MATTLNRQQTDLFFCQRLQQNESGNNGDWFRWAFSFSGFTDSVYNAFVSDYEANETEAEHDPTLLTGTHPDGTTFTIGKAPSGRPHPPQK